MTSLTETKQLTSSSQTALSLKSSYSLDSRSLRCSSSLFAKRFAGLAHNFFLLQTALSLKSSYSLDSRSPPARPLCSTNNPLVRLAFFFHEFAGDPRINVLKSIIARYRQVTDYNYTMLFHSMSIKITKFACLCRLFHKRADKIGHFRRIVRHNAGDYLRLRVKQPCIYGGFVLI